jgi:hypothetical protein
MLLEIFLVIVGSVIGLANFISIIAIMMDADSDMRVCVLASAKESVALLFQQRNTFGTLLSVVILITLLPCFILAFLLQCIYWCFDIAKYIWELGKKKSE